MSAWGEKIADLRELALRHEPSPADAAGLLVATGLVILMEHKHTAGDAVRLIVDGCQRGLRRHEARLIELANTWRRP